MAYFYYSFSLPRALAPPKFQTVVRHCLQNPYLLHNQTLACRIQLGICPVSLATAIFDKGFAAESFATSQARCTHQVSRDTIEALEKRGADCI